MADEITEKKEEVIKDTSSNATAKDPNSYWYNILFNSLNSVSGQGLLWYNALSGKASSAESERIAAAAETEKYKALVNSQAMTQTARLATVAIIAAALVFLVVKKK